MVPNLIFQDKKGAFQYQLLNNFIDINQRPMRPVGEIVALHQYSRLYIPNNGQAQYYYFTEIPVCKINYQFDRDSLVAAFSPVITRVKDIFGKGEYQEINVPLFPNEATFTRKISTRNLESTEGHININYYIDWATDLPKLGISFVPRPVNALEAKERARF